MFASTREPRSPITGGFYRRLKPTTQVGTGCTRITPLKLPAVLASEDKSLYGIQVSHPTRQRVAQSEKGQLVVIIQALWCRNSREGDRSEYWEMSSPEPPLTKEDDHKRGARELIELLQELRVVLPGVQVLFAFLLMVPFTQRFTELTPLQQYVFFATLLCAAIAAALLIAPSAHHRLLWRRRQREQRLRIGNTLSIAGLLFLVPGMLGALFVIADLLFGLLVAAIVAGVLVGVLMGLWFGIPLWYRKR